MFKWLQMIFGSVQYTKDLSAHRAHTTKYEDLCM